MVKTKKISERDFFLSLTVCVFYLTITLSYFEFELKILYHSKADIINFSMMLFVFWYFQEISRFFLFFENCTFFWHKVYYTPVVDIIVIFLYLKSWSFVDNSTILNVWKILFYCLVMVVWKVTNFCVLR